jgi:hypothetical protein
MRRLPLLTVTLVLPVIVSACGSMETRDTNAAVDADPLCASQPNQPNEPTGARCERRTEVTFERKREPLDLSGKSGSDDDPR